ncbi:hypothetical protein FPV67DRAFT_301281 [Lyophyllum atratum]|nr:hypothetical protein FPV67DRAFT_301281 [Lyophyllum atratum]
MTEYDYSPDAYERYMQTQHRIAQWVDQTEEHRPEFDENGEPHRRPSRLQRPSNRQQSHSMYQPRRRRGSSSSSSSSSSEPYSNSPISPGPMPVPTFQSMYVQPQTTPPMTTIYPPQHPDSRHHSSSHHHRSPKYIMTPPTSPPAQAYPYPYGTTTGPGQVLSPGGYVYPTKHGAASVGSPSFYQPPAQGYHPQSSYFPPQTQAPRTAPYGGFYGQSQALPLASPPAQYPQNAAYPPTIYPVTTYGVPGQQQQLTQKPVFFQRVFGGGSGSGRKKGRKSSRRSH